MAFPADIDALEAVLKVGRAVPCPPPLETDAFGLTTTARTE
jgi:hypothetical protein